MRPYAFLVSLMVALSAHAQPFPAKPIHVVVPSPPGGPPDLIIRMLAPKMNLGQPLVIENRAGAGGIVDHQRLSDRKSTRLNSSHRCISYAVFCLKKKKKNDKTHE